MPISPKKFDRRAYMRQYMRDRRQSTRTRTPSDWLSALRYRYAAFLAAQRRANAYRDTATLLGTPADLPPHLDGALRDAEAAFDAHAALDPPRAAEYVARHAAAALDREAAHLRALIARLPPSRRRGRPVTAGGTSTAERDAQRALDAAAVARAAADAEYLAALDASPPLNARDAGRIQTRLHAARARHERAAERLDALRAARDRRVAADAALDRDRRELTARLAEAEAERDALLAPFPTVTAPYRPARRPGPTPPERPAPTIGRRRVAARATPTTDPDPTGGLA